MPARYLLIALLILAPLTLAGAAFYYLSPSQTVADLQFPAAPLADKNSEKTIPPKELKAVWFTDYKNSSAKAVNRAGEIIWEQHFSFPSANEDEPSNIEFITISPNGNPLVTTANGMLIQEIDRATHKTAWQYGILNQQYCDQCLHQPKKAYLFNDHEVLVTDANARRVIIIDKNTNQIIWEYGVKNAMKDAPGYLKGNRFAVPLDGAASKILISDTLTKRVIIVDRQTKKHPMAMGKTR